MKTNDLHLGIEPAQVELVGGNLSEEVVEQQLSDENPDRSGSCGRVEILDYEI
jgi:hypothetical protein